MVVIVVVADAVSFFPLKYSLQRLAEYMHIAAAVTAGVEIIIATCAWALAICRGGCDCCSVKERVIVVSDYVVKARQKCHIYLSNLLCFVQ